MLSGCSCSHMKEDYHIPHVKINEYKPYNEQDALKYVEKYLDENNKELSTDLALRCYTSNLIGEKASLVLHGGGNTSVKSVATNQVNETFKVLGVKGSGYNLDSIVPKGFPLVRMNHLEKLLTLDNLEDPLMVNELRSNMMDSKSPTPSVETLLHALIPSKFVDHSHADAIVSLADHDIDTATKLFTEAFKDEPALQNFAIVKYVMPGFGLAKEAKRVFDNTPGAQCVILLKHGLFTFGETAKESYELHIKAVSLAEQFLVNKCQYPELTKIPYIKPSGLFVEKILLTIRGLFEELYNELHLNDLGNVGMGKHNPGWVLNVSRDPVVFNFIQSKECEKLSQIGTITPDHVIRTKSKPCLIKGLVEAEFYKENVLYLKNELPDEDSNLREYLKEILQNYCEQYEEYFIANNKRVGGIKQMLDPLPRVLLIENLGLVTVGRSKKETKIACDIYEHTVPVILSSISSENSYEPASMEDLFDCEYWSLEQAKLKLGNNNKTKELSGRVCYVTGGGSGIGLETARLLAENGCNLFLVDLDMERIASSVSELSKITGVIGAVVDVTNEEDIEKSFSQCVEAFGGVDIVISNAGIVVQTPISMASCDFNLLLKSMNVNFFAHQHVSAAASRRLITQNTGGCLLYNISKAPVAPGLKMGPYCIAKSATNALMRQYALEMGKYQIRSNSVNADRVRTNLFDLKLVTQRASARGLTADKYFSLNLTNQEVKVRDVANAFLHLALALKTSACTLTVDGGKIENALR